MSAAKPFSANKFCCVKHARMREVAENSGETFSVPDDEAACSADDVSS